MQCELKLFNKGKQFIGAKQPNNTRSKLFESLATKFKEDVGSNFTKTALVYDYINSEEFKYKYGDWTIENRLHIPPYVGKPENVINKNIRSNFKFKGEKQNTINIKINDSVFSELKNLVDLKGLKQGNKNSISITFKHGDKKLKVSFSKDISNKANSVDLEAEENAEQVFNNLFSNRIYFDSLQSTTILHKDIKLNSNKELSMNSIDYLLNNDEVLKDSLNKLYEEEFEQRIDKSNLSENIQEAIDSAKALSEKLDRLKKTKKVVLLQFENVKKIFASKVYNHKLGLSDDFDSNLDDINLVYQIVNNYLEENEDLLSDELKNIFYKNANGDRVLNEKILYGIHVEINNELKKLNVNLKGNVTTLEAQYENLLEEDLEDTNELTEVAEKHGANKYDLENQGFNFIDKKLRAFIEYTTYKEKDIVKVEKSRLKGETVTVIKKGEEKLINGETVFRLLQMYMSKEYNSKSDLNFDELFLMLSLENEQTKALYDKYIKALSTNPNIREMFIRELNTVAINHITLLNDPEALKSRVFSSNLNDYDKIQFDQWNSSWQIIKSGIITKKTDGSVNKNNNFESHIDKINKIKNRFNLIQTSLTLETLNTYLDDFLSPISEYNIENATGIKLSRMYLKYSILKSLSDEQIKNLNLSDAEVKLLNIDIEKHFIGKSIDTLLLTSNFFEIFSNLASESKFDFDPYNTSYENANILTVNKKPKSNSEMTYRIKNIALANSVFDENIIQTSFRNAANDLLHGFAKPGYLTKAVKTLSSKEHRNSLKNGLDKRYINPKIVQNNTLLNLDERVQDSVMNDMQLMYINNITQSSLTEDSFVTYDTPEGSDYKNITAKVYTLSSLSYFLDRKKYRALYGKEAGSKVYIDRFLLNPYILETSNTSHGVLMPVGLPTTTLSGSLKIESFIQEKGNVFSMSDTVLNLFANKAVAEYNKMQDRKATVRDGIEDYFRFILSTEKTPPNTPLNEGYDLSIDKNNDKGKRVKIGKAFKFFLFKNMINSTKNLDVIEMSKVFDKEMKEFEESLNEYFDKLSEAKNKEDLEKIIEENRTNVNLDRGTFLNDVNQIKEFKNAYQEYIDSEFNKWINNALIKENLAEYDSLGELKNILVAENIDQQGAFNESLNVIKEEYDGNFSKMLYDYFINNTFWTMDFNELVSGDMASRKDSTDYNKRIKGGASSGSQLAEGEIKVAYIKDPVFNHKTLGEIDVADAQSYSTASRYQEIVRYQGRLTKEVSGIIQKIKLGLPITHAEREMLDTNKATANPVKDLYYNVNVFHKDSVAFLLPELTSYIPTYNQDRYNDLVARIKALETYKFMSVNPNNQDGIARYNDSRESETDKTYEELSEEIKEAYKELNSLWLPKHDYLHDLRLNMERDGVEIVIPHSGSKLLSKVIIDPIEDKSSSNISKDFNLNYSSHTIDGAYWREVVEVNSGKKKITYFSQIMRLVESGHGNNTEESLLLSQDGNITDINTELANYRKRLGSKRVKSFMSAINVLQLEDGEYTNESVRLFYEKLESTLRSSGGSQLMIELFENPNIDKNIPVTSEKFIQLFLAHFNKGTLKQKATGLKLTLFSSEGLEVIESIDKDGNVRIINSIELEEIRQRSLEKLRDPDLDVEGILEEIENLELQKLNIEEDDISYDDKIRNLNNEIRNRKLLINSEYDEIMKARSVVTYSVNDAATGSDKITYETYDVYEEIEEEVIIGYEEPEIVNEMSISEITSDKNVLTRLIKPANTTDAKAKVKAKISNKFIGYGVTINNREGATSKYQRESGTFANTSNYNSNNVVFVSVPGRRGAIGANRDTVNKAQENTIEEALLAIKSGAVLVTDNTDYIFTEKSGVRHPDNESISYYEDKDLYNIGEIKLYKRLIKAGYKAETITVDNQELNIWRKYTTEELENIQNDQIESLITDRVEEEAESYKKSKEFKNDVKEYFENFKTSDEYKIGDYLKTIKLNFDNIKAETGNSFRDVNKFYYTNNKAVGKAKTIEEVAEDLEIDRSKVIDFITTHKSPTTFEKNIKSDYKFELINNFKNKLYSELSKKFNNKESASEIYNKLGTKTATNNVEIVEAYQEKAKELAKEKRTITAMRFKSNTHYGNPFSSKVDENGKPYDKKRLDKIKKDFPETVFVDTVQEAVEKYIDWVLNSNDARANWIRSVLKSGKLKGKKIHYYKELNQPSHATALDYLINEYDWNAETVSKELNKFQETKKVNDFVQISSNNNQLRNVRERKPIFKTIKKKVKTGTATRQITIPFVAEKNRNEQNTVLLDGTTIRRRRLRFSKPELNSDFIFKVKGSKTPIVIKTNNDFFQKVLEETDIKAGELKSLRLMINELNKIDKADISDFGKIYENYEKYKKELSSTTLQTIEEFIKTDIANNPNNNYLKEDLELVFGIGAVTKQGFSEVMIPRFESFQYDITSEQFQSKVQQEALKVFGGRIPSQEWHSMISAKVVDFLPSAMGDTVAAPHEIVAISGADFDIDSIYLIRKSIANLKGIDLYGNETDILYEFGTNLSQDEVIAIKANEILKDEIANIFLDKTIDTDYLKYLELNNKIKATIPFYETLSSKDKNEHNARIKERNKIATDLKRRGKEYLFEKNNIITNQKYKFRKVLENAYSTLRDQYARDPELLKRHEKEIKYKLFIKTYLKTDPRIKFEVKTELEKSRILTSLENELDSLKNEHADKIKKISEINEKLNKLYTSIEDKIKNNKPVGILKIGYSKLVSDLTITYNEINSITEQQFRLSKAIDDTTNQITIDVMETNGLTSVENFENTDNPLALHNQVVDSNINLYNDPSLVNIASYNENDPGKKVDVGSTQSPAVMYKIQGTKGKKSARNANGLLIELLNVGDMFTEMRGAQSVNNYDMFTPNGRLIAFKSNKIASKLIGPAAIAKILRAKLEALSVSTPKIIWDGKELKKGFGTQMSYDIEFKKIVDERTKKVIDYEVIVHNDENNPVVFRIDDELSTLISVATDAPKWNDPYKLQLAFETLGTYLYLISVGVGSNRAMTLAQMSFIQMMNDSAIENNHQVIMKETVFQKKGKKLLLGPVTFDSNENINGGIFTAINIMLNSTANRLNIKTKPLEIRSSKYSNIVNCSYNNGKFSKIKKENIRTSTDNIFNSENNKISLKNNTINISLNSKDLFNAVNTKDILNDVFTAIGKTPLDLEIHDLKPIVLLNIIDEFSKKVISSPTPANKELYSQLVEIIDTNFKAVMFYEQANIVSSELLNFVNILQIDKGVKPSFEEIDKVKRSMDKLGIHVITLSDSDYNRYKDFKITIRNKSEFEISEILKKFKSEEFGFSDDSITQEDKDFYQDYNDFARFKDIQPVIYDEFNNLLEKESNYKNSDQKYYIAIQNIPDLYVDYEPVISDPIVQGNLVAIHKIRDEIAPKMIVTRNVEFNSILENVLYNDQFVSPFEESRNSLMLGSGNKKLQNIKYLQKQLLVYLTKKVLDKNGSKLKINPGLLFDLYNKEYTIERTGNNKVRYVNKPDNASSEINGEVVEDVLYNKFLKAVSENEVLQGLHITKLITSPVYKKDNYRSPTRFGIESFITKSDALSAQLQSDLLVIKSENEDLYNDIINYLLTKDGLLMSNESLMPYIGEDVFLELSYAIQQLKSVSGSEFMNLVSNYNYNELVDYNDFNDFIHEISSNFLDLLMTTPKGISFLPNVKIKNRKITSAMLAEAGVTIVNDPNIIENEFLIINDSPVEAQEDMLGYKSGVKYFKNSYSNKNKNYTDVYRKVAELHQESDGSTNYIYIKMPDINLTKDVSPFAFEELNDILNTEAIIIDNSIKQQFTNKFYDLESFKNEQNTYKKQLKFKSFSQIKALIENFDIASDYGFDEEMELNTIDDIKDYIKKMVDTSLSEEDMKLEFLEKEVELKNYITSQTSFVENVNNVDSIKYQVYLADNMPGKSLMLELNNKEIKEVPKTVNTLEDLKDIKLTSNSILFISEDDYNNVIYKEAIDNHFDSYTVIIQSVKGDDVLYKTALGNKFINVTEDVIGIPEIFTVMGNGFDTAALAEETIINGIKTEKDYNTDFIEENKLKLSHFEKLNKKEIGEIKDIIDVKPEITDKDNIYANERIEKYKERNSEQNLTTEVIANTVGGRFLFFKRLQTKTKKLTGNNKKGDYIKLKFKNADGTLSLGKLKSNPFKIAKNIKDVESVSINSSNLKSIFGFVRKNSQNKTLTPNQIKKLEEKNYQAPNEQVIKKASGNSEYNIKDYQANAEAWIRLNSSLYDGPPNLFYTFFEKLVRDVYSEFYKIDEFNIQKYIDENGGLAFIDSINFTQTSTSTINKIKRKVLKDIYTQQSLQERGFVYDSLSVDQVQQLMLINNKRATKLLSNENLSSDENLNYIFLDVSILGKVKNNKVELIKTPDYKLSNAIYLESGIETFYNQKRPISVFESVADTYFTNINSNDLIGLDSTYKSNYLTAAYFTASNNLNVTNTTFSNFKETIVGQTFELANKIQALKILTDVFSKEKIDSDIINNLTKDFKMGSVLTEKKYLEFFKKMTDLTNTYSTLNAQMDNLKNDILNIITSDLLGINDFNSLFSKVKDSFDQNIKKLEDAINNDDTIEDNEKIDLLDKLENNKKLMTDLENINDILNELSEKVYKDMHIFNVAVKSMIQNGTRFDKLKTYLIERSDMTDVFNKLLTKEFIDIHNEFEELIKLFENKDITDLPSTC